MNWKIGEPRSNSPESNRIQQPPSRVGVQYKSEGGAQPSPPVQLGLAYPLLQLLDGKKKKRKGEKQDTNAYVKQLTK